MSMGVFLDVFWELFSKRFSFWALFLKKRSAVGITDIFTAGDTTADPATSGDLRDEVLRVLDVLLEGGDHGGEDTVEGSLRDRTTLLANANLFGVHQETLDIRITTTAGHEGDS